MTTLNFSGKRVLITGGSGDIGHALSDAFARHGADVAFTFFMNHEGKRKTEAAIEASGQRALSIRANLRDRNACTEIANTVVNAWGGVDIFISNAATGVLKPAMQTKDKHWDATMDVNATSFLSLTRLLAPHMSPGGRVMAMSSAGSVKAIENYALIGASKAALESLVRHLAMELGPKGITVNALSPGVVDTRALQHFPNREQLISIATMRTPNGRLVTPADVAEVALLIASPLAGQIQGQTIVIDGGYSILA